MRGEREKKEVKREERSGGKKKMRKEMEKKEVKRGREKGEKKREMRGER